MDTTSGRQRYTEPQRRAHLQRFEHSGLSQAEFCRQAKIPAATFSQWRKTAQNTTVPAFAEVQLSAAAPTGSAMLHLPGGTKLEVVLGAEAAWLGLGLLLKTLQA